MNRHASRATVASRRRLYDPVNGRLRSYPWVSGAVLALIAFAMYAASLRGGFVYDDEELILENPFVVNPHLWHRIFTGSIFSFQGVGAANNFYRPLGILCYWLLYRLAGPQPAVFHCVLVLLYALTVWVVYRLGCRLLQNELAAFGGALLWAVHPQHVEAVAWLAGWFEVGFGLFYVLAFLLFLRAETASERQALQHGAAALAYLPALFFKEMAASFPLLVLAWWFFHPARQPWRKRAVCFAPYVAAAGVYLTIRRLALGHLTTASYLWRVSPRVVAAALGLLGQHTKIFFWPLHLSVFRSFDLDTSLRSPWPWAALLTLVAALLLRRRQPTLSFLIFWWPVTLLPCLDLRQLSVPLLADRFSYVPSVGLCLAIALLVLKLLPALAPRSRSVRLAVPALMLVAVLLAVETRRAITPWLDNESLVNHSLQESPDAPSLHIVRGWTLEYRNNDLAGAEREFETALVLNSRDVRPLPNVIYNAYIGLGQVAYRRRQLEEAIAYLRKAIRVLPNLGEAYQVLGAVYFPQRKYATAAEYFAQAVRADPMNLEARFYLGTCLMELGRYREAGEQFRAATSIDPTFRQAYRAEARAWEAAGDSRAAAAVRALIGNQ